MQPNRVMLAVLVPAVVAFGLMGCREQTQESAPANPVAEADSQSGNRDAAHMTGDASTELHALFERYFETYLELHPTFATYIGDNRFNDQYQNDIGPEWLAAARRLEEESLATARAIDASSLQGQDLLSLEIFIADREVELEGFGFPDHLMPINQFRNTALSFVQMGTGTGTHPFKSVRDYDHFLHRIDGFVAWMDQAQANMREGMAQGLTPPRILMERVLPQLQSQLVERVEESGFYQPIHNLPDGFSAGDRERLGAAYATAIEQKLLPAYRGMLEFIRDEYIPRARETDGMAQLPDGAAWYAHRVRHVTTTGMTPEQIHAIGLNEVERIHGEMREVMEQVKFAGDLDEFFEFLNTDPRFYYTTRGELLNGFNALREAIEPNAPRLFRRIPDAGYEIRLVEPFREQTASAAQYRGASPDGSRPGVFFVNAYDLAGRPKWAMESLFLHEAVPGHHYQGALMLELDELPRFRQFGGYTVYGEGWGLYAESLGHDLGAYTDPYSYFGKLNAELWRAVRLVADTGLHHYGWTREQVLEYMSANAAVAEARAVAETERFMAIPGQALAYKVGQLKFQELRERAEVALGNQFDIREFHARVLEEGELPLNVLEARIDEWIAASSQQGPGTENERTEDATTGK